MRREGESEEAKVPDRFLCVTYCDDIRHEAGNKISYMGIYRRDMFVPEIPFTVPKLCIAVDALTKADNPFGNVELVVSFNDEELYRRKISEEQVSELRKQNQELSDGDAGQQHMHVLRVYLQISPFEIASEGILRVRLITESGELRGPALRISKVLTGHVV